MMPEDLTEEIAKKLMEVKGEVKGVVFKTDAEFISREKGAEGLRKVENELKRIGYPIEYKNIKTMAYYPMGLRALSLLAIQQALNFSNEEIKRMGASAPKFSLIIKLFLQYFLSVQKTAEKACEIWEGHYTAGQLSAKSNEEEKYAILRLKDLTLHPLLCRYLEGYFSTIVQMVVKSPVTSKETKCSFKGDDYHEFLLRW